MRRSLFAERTTKIFLSEFNFPFKPAYNDTTHTTHLPLITTFTNLNLVSLAIQCSLSLHVYPGRALHIAK